jgi:hypothetical protein
MLRPTKTEVTHYYEIPRERGCEWPDILWPVWKPNATKTMHVTLIRFSTINGRLGRVYASGHNVTKDGVLGATRTEHWYSDDKLPEFIQEIVERRHA